MQHNCLKTSFMQILRCYLDKADCVNPAELDGFEIFIWFVTGWLLVYVASSRQLTVLNSSAQAFA